MASDCLEMCQHPAFCTYKGLRSVIADALAGITAESKSWTISETCSQVEDLRSLTEAYDHAKK